MRVIVESPPTVSDDPSRRLLSFIAMSLIEARAINVGADVSPITYMSVKYSTTTRLCPVSKLKWLCPQAPRRLVGLAIMRAVAHIQHPLTLESIIVVHAKRSEIFKPAGAAI